VLYLKAPELPHQSAVNRAVTERATLKDRADHTHVERAQVSSVAAAGGWSADQAIGEGRRASSPRLRRRTCSFS
jgi:hypothetical protein